MDKMPTQAIGERDGKPAGTFGGTGDNETMLRSLIDDPGKHNFDVPGPGRSLGCFSFRYQGRERVLVQAKLSDDYKRGEFGIWCYDEDRPIRDPHKDPEDQRMNPPVFYVSPQGVWINGVPLGNTPAQPEGGFPNKLVSPDGVCELDMQNADAPGAVAYMHGKPFARLMTLEEIARALRGR